MGGRVVAGLMSVPRLALPLRYRNGRYATVQQDSPEDIEQRVMTILAFRPGQRRGSPDFGSPSVNFEQNPDLASLVEAVGKWDAAADATIASNGRDAAGGVLQRAIMRVSDSGGGVGG